MFTTIVLLLVGVATFLTGMNMMSSGLKKATGNNVKRLFGKLQNNRLAGLGIGAATTAVIQSSAATSIMAIGFLNAGAISLFQGLSILMGAYIGTTVTGLLVSISSLGGAGFDISLIFMLLAFIGVVLSFFKKDLVKHIGEICTGLGLLFFGLFTLKGVFGDLKDLIQSIFLAVNNNPLLLFVIGIVLTMLVQSSSASTGIMIVMCSTGAVNIASAIYVALGATVGTVVTTLIATIGGTENAKRLGIIAFIMRLVTASLFLIILWPLAGVINDFGNIIDKQYYGLFIAVFMVLYNIITMLGLLPFIEKFELLGNKLVKDKSKDELKSYVKYIDDKLLGNPSVAMMQVEKEIINMNEYAFENYKRGFEAIISGNLKDKELIDKTEDGIDYLNNKITDFLISLSNSVNEKDSKIIGGYFHAINDIERIGDHAENFIDSATKMHELDLKFSDVAVKELKELNEIINQMFLITFDNLANPSKGNAEKIHELEEKTDVLKDKISTEHYNRITKGKCKVELSPFICTLVSELERVADHLTNIGYIYTNPTGDEDRK